MWLGKVGQRTSSDSVLGTNNPYLCGEKELVGSTRPKRPHTADRKLLRGGAQALPCAILGHVGRTPLQEGRKQGLQGPSNPWLPSMINIDRQKQ